MLALVLAISSSTALTSCSKDDNNVPRPEQPLVLTGEAAVEKMGSEMFSFRQEGLYSVFCKA